MPLFLFGQLIFVLLSQDHSLFDTMVSFSCAFVLVRHRYRRKLFRCLGLRFPFPFSFFLCIFVFYVYLLLLVCIKEVGPKGLLLG